MRALSSLRSRIFLASAVLAVLCIVVAIYLVNVRVTEEAERTLQREIVAAAALVDNLRTTRTETFTQMARFIADAPPLKAAVDTNDPPTVRDIANRYQDQVKSNLLIVTNRAGGVLATVGGSGRSAPILSNQPAIRDGLAGRETLSLLPQPDGMIQLVTVPVYVGITRPDILGTLSVGFMLDNALAAQLKQISLSDIAFGMNGQILAATLPPEYYPLLAAAAVDRHFAAAARGRRIRSAAAAAGLDRRQGAGRLRPGGADSPLAHGAAAVAAVDPRRAARHGRARGAAGDVAELRGRPDDRPAAGRDHRRDARGRGDRRPHAQDRAAPRQPLGRRRRAAAGDDVQHLDRFDRAVPARDVAEGAAHRARAPVHGHRA